jgi:DNA-3-methyladenine glycosylase I
VTTRCSWAEGSDAAMLTYHDLEWGVPHHDDSGLFELLTLEGAQAGLSWRTILARREEYRRAYHGFNIKRIAGMRDNALEKLLATSGIVRNRQKVFSVRDNARAALDVIAEHGSLDAYLWSFVGGSPLVNG